MLNIKHFLNMSGRAARRLLEFVALLFVVAAIGFLVQFFERLLPENVVSLPAPWGPMIRVRSSLCLQTLAALWLLATLQRGYPLRTLFRIPLRTTAGVVTAAVASITLAALLIDSGVVSPEELGTGRAHSPGTPSTPPLNHAQAAAFVSRCDVRFDRPSNRSPLFHVGQGVRAKAMGTVGHTRLPGYARGRAGRVAHFRGHHVLPDASARGREVAEPLYTVAFAASELWPEAAHSKDDVMIDLWESYLEPP